MSNEFDAIIIGTGQSGPSLASRRSAAGMKVAVIAPIEGPVLIAARLVREMRAIVIDTKSPYE